MQGEQEGLTGVKGAHQSHICLHGGEQVGRLQKLGGQRGGMSAWAMLGQKGGLLRLREQGGGLCQREGFCQLAYVRGSCG